MMQVISSRAGRLCVLAAGFLLALPAAVQAFEAPSKPMAAPPQPAAAKEADSNNPKAQIRILTEQMNAGQLDEGALARALLKRGVAHSSLGHYTKALADLTGAIYIGKLSDGETREAYRERARAYGETGQTRMAEQDAAKAGGAASPVAARRPAREQGDTDMSALQLPDFKTSVAPAAAASEPAPAAAPAAPAPGAKPLPSFKTSIAHE